MRYKTYLTTALTAAVALTCGGPLEPLPSAWEYKSPLPTWDDAITCGDEGVYIINNDTIYKYDRQIWNEEYAAPEGTAFYDIDFSGDAGWAVGSYANKAFIVCYDGARWTEVDIRNDELEILTNVVSVNATGCWLIGKEQDIGSRKFIYFWDGNKAEKEAPTVDVTDVAYSPGSSTLYAKRPKTALITELVITGDKGVTWDTEEMPTAINGYDVSGIWSMAAVGDALYYIATGDDAAFRFTVVKRTGAPGEGKYEISFASPLGPNVQELRDLAFTSPGRGVAVGHYTSAIYDEPRWHTEASSPHQFNLVTADAHGGFWALGTDPSGIYYHP